MKIIFYRVKDDEIILSREMFTYLMSCKKHCDNEEFAKKVTKEFKINTKNMLSERNKEISRLNNIINELEKELKEAYNELQPNELINGRELLLNILCIIKDMKEGKK